MRLLAIWLLFFTSTSLISEENPKMFSPKEATSKSINFYNCKNLGGNNMINGIKGSGTPPDDTKVNVSYDNDYIYLQKIYVNDRDDRYTGYPRVVQTRKSEISGMYLRNSSSYSISIKKTSEDTYFVTIGSIGWVEGNDDLSVVLVNWYECKTK